MQSSDYGASMRAEFERREELRRKRFQNVLDDIREESTQSPEEVAELKARLARLQNMDAPAHRNVVDLDE